mmetsp:Transcript_25020/g.58541  ORF Transcript_25020/g.58541 Transcript_25020/m.58541 type:complete len:212 (+) Transcript_25020:118-753(+)
MTPRRFVAYLYVPNTGNQKSKRLFQKSITFDRRGSAKKVCIIIGDVVTSESPISDSTAAGANIKRFYRKGRRGGRIATENTTAVGKFVPTRPSTVHWNVIGKSRHILGIVISITSDDEVVFIIKAHWHGQWRIVIVLSDSTRGRSSYISSSRSGIARAFDGLSSSIFIASSDALFLLCKGVVICESSCAEFRSRYLPIHLFRLGTPRSCQQ